MNGIPGFNVAPLDLGFNVQPVEHDNTWMQIPGQIGGGIIGSFFFPPFGSMIGSKAGGAFGSGLGDAIAGNWNGVFQDALKTLPPELMNLFGLRL
jgi:hypothetical protein